MPRTRVVRSGDSVSLWNYTLSPGWTDAEAEVLRSAIIKYGVGAWGRISAANCLLGKNPAQIALQTQRLLGQQSLREFQGIRLDPREIFELNTKKTGVKRKNGMIIREGVYPSAADFARMQDENRKRYEVPQERSDAIVLPRAEEMIKQQENSVDVKERRLEALYRRAEYFFEYIKQRFHADPLQLELQLRAERAASLSTTGGAEDVEAKRVHVDNASSS